MRKQGKKGCYINKVLLQKKLEKLVAGRQKSVLYAKKASLGVPIPSLALAKFLLSHALQLSISL